MIVLPMNPNSIRVPMVQTGCLKAEFDPTYPIHLNGIISQDEFRQSIENINRTISSNQIKFVCAILFGLCIICGLTLIVVGGIVRSTSGRSGLPILVGIGFGVVFFGIISVSVGCCIIQSQRTIRIRQAVAEESMKYSMRSPTPCSWRLNVIGGGYGRRNRRQISYHLIIDIGHDVAPGHGTFYLNQAAPQPTFSFQQQDNIPPPPYPGQSAGFCSQCGMPRSGLMAQFCSSCGQSFNKY